jgi:hypothetical protein
MPAGEIYGYLSGMPAGEIYGCLSGMPAGEIYGCLSGMPAGEIYGYLSGMPAGEIYGYLSGMPAGEIYGCLSGMPAGEIYGYLSGRPAVCPWPLGRFLPLACLTRKKWLSVKFPTGRISLRGFPPVGNLTAPHRFFFIVPTRQRRMIGAMPISCTQRDAGASRLVPTPARGNQKRAAINLRKMASS